MRRSTGNKRVLEQYEGKNIRRILFSDNPGMLNERGGIPGFFCYILTEEKKKMVENELFMHLFILKSLKSPWYNKFVKKK